MIALLLGVISLIIAIMFTTSFDKLANEIRDMRIKYLKIDYILNQLKQRKTLKVNDNEPVQEEESGNEPFDLDSAYDNDSNYYINSNFKEKFRDEDIVEEFK